MKKTLLFITCILTICTSNLVSANQFGCIHDGAQQGRFGVLKSLEIAQNDLTIKSHGVDNPTQTDVSIIVNDFQNGEGDFAISPNPARDKFQIKLPKLLGDLKLEVFDVLGKRVYTGVLTKLESSINVSNWKSGVYMVRLSNQNFSKTKRFIKQ